MEAGDIAAPLGVFFFFYLVGWGVQSSASPLRSVCFLNLFLIAVFMECASEPAALETAGAESGACASTEMSPEQTQRSAEDGEKSCRVLEARSPRVAEDVVTASLCEETGSIIQSPRLSKSYTPFQLVSDAGSLPVLTLLLIDFSVVYFYKLHIQTSYFLPLPSPNIDFLHLS